MSFANLFKREEPRTEPVFAIRWLMRRDMPEVMAIERQCFEFAWTENDFLDCLRQRNCIGMVAELDDRIVGFMVYELHKDKLHILNFAVAPEHQRNGFGSLMVDKLLNKLSSQRRHSITLEIRERNLPAQLFFKSRDFFCYAIGAGYYDDTNEDCYLFEYQCQESEITNRLSRYFA